MTYCGQCAAIYVQMQANKCVHPQDLRHVAMNECPECSRLGVSRHLTGVHYDLTAKDKATLARQRAFYRALMAQVMIGLGMTEE